MHIHNHTAMRVAKKISPWEIRDIATQKTNFSLFWGYFFLSHISKTSAFCSENLNIFGSFIRGLNDTISERRGAQ